MPQRCGKCSHQVSSRVSLGLSSTGGGGGGGGGGKGGEGGGANVIIVELRGARIL